MPNVIDNQGVVVFTGKSDAECVRWWRDEGHVDDRMEDTGELMYAIADELRLWD